MKENKRGREIEGKMKIEHITYDEAHGRPRISVGSHEEAKSILSTDEQRPVTMWPRTGKHSTPTEKVPEMAARLTQENRQKKGAAAQKTSKPSSMTGYSQTTDASQERRGEVEVQKSRLGEKERAPNKTLHIPLQPTSTELPHLADLTDIQQLKLLRQAIHRGEFERVIPPPNITSSHETPRHAPPPRPSRNHLSPAVRPTHHRSKSSSKSSSSSFFAVLEEGALALDETCRGFVGKLGHLPTIGGSRRGSRVLGAGGGGDGGDSDEEFWCVGEGLEESLMLGKRRSEEEVEKRRSGAGVENLKECRVFGKRVSRNLCDVCENVFLESQKEDPDISTELLDDIKPTPLLRIRKMLPQKLEAAVRESEVWEDDIRESVMVEENLDVTPKPVHRLSNSHKPEVINSNLVRQDSLEATVEESEEKKDSAEKLKRWQGVVAKRPVKGKKKLLERWSAVYSKGEVAEVEKGDMSMLMDTVDAALKRRTSFYEFYDEILTKPEGG